MNDTAIHEAGHAVMALDVEDERIGGISLEAEGDVAGSVHLAEAKSDAARVATILAGAATAAAIGGRSLWAEWAGPSAKSDMKIARVLCKTEENLEKCKQLVASAVMGPDFQSRVLTLAAVLEERGRLSGREVRSILEGKGNEEWRLT